MDVTTRAIALRATDYKENDKLALLYSLEYGKISVHARGVRKNTAKLKFACDQFCFGQYELAKTDDRFTLKTCQQLESFFALREDVVMYYAACSVAECLVNYTEEGQSDPDTFIETLKALQSLVNGTNPLAVTLRFLQKFLELQGFKLGLDSCVACNAKSKHMFLDLQRGGLVCDMCRTADSLVATNRAISSCKMLENMPYEKLNNVKISNEILKEALDLCYRYVTHSFSPLKSLNELLKLA